MHVTNIDQSEASIQVTWSVLTNQRAAEPKQWAIWWSHWLHWPGWRVLILRPCQDITTFAKVFKENKTKYFRLRLYNKVVRDLRQPWDCVRLWEKDEYSVLFCQMDRPTDPELLIEPKTISQVLVKILVPVDPIPLPNFNVKQWYKPTDLIGIGVDSIKCRWTWCVGVECRSW